MTREEEIKQTIDQMFPYYEDMSDIEVLQTTSRRIGAEKAFEYADQHPSTETLKDFITRNGYVHQDKLILEFTTNVCDWIDKHMDKYYTSRYIINMFKKSTFINALRRAMINKKHVKH